MLYLDGIKTDAPVNADNALVLGTALHTGIEQSVETAIKQYCFSYPIISDEHINEIIKLETVIPMAKAALPTGGSFEVPISNSDYNGFIDYLVPVEPLKTMEDAVSGGKCICKYKTFDLYDFKYSNNREHYRKSPQIHLYKYFWEKENPGCKIRNLYYLFVPKVSIRQKKDEDLTAFRSRLEGELQRVSVHTELVPFDYDKVIDWCLQVKGALEETEFNPQQSYLCRYCEFQEYCEKGWNYFMKLPENKRRNIETVTKRVIWIYGVPFCGKTTFANNFPDPLMLNTDGNYRFVDAPVIPIKDEVKIEGRQTKRKMAWEVFKETIDELEKKDNTFKTIIVDLLEDMYEHCRVYMYREMGISHESDDSFRAWDKVRGEFLNTLKRLMNLEYENIILISHEDTTKDITKKGGDKITAIKPNIQDKVANKVSGMVDVVARIVADDDVRTFNFKSNEVIFGGGRLKVAAKSIPLDVQALFDVYDDANHNAANSNATVEKPVRGRRTAATEAEVKAPVTEQVEDKTASSVKETPVEPDENTKPAETEPETVKDDPVTVAAGTTEEPRRRRKARD